MGCRIYPLMDHPLENKSLWTLVERTMSKCSTWLLGPPKKKRVLIYPLVRIGVLTKQRTWNRQGSPVNLGVEKCRKRGQAMVTLSPFGEWKLRCVLVRTYPRIGHPDYKEQNSSYTWVWRHTREACLDRGRTLRQQDAKDHQTVVRWWLVTR